MQQNITESAIANKAIANKPRFDTEGRKPTWYRVDIMPKKVGHARREVIIKRMFIGSGEDCMVDELNILTEEEECTS